MKIVKKFEMSEDEIIFICITLMVIIFTLSSCHPYPYKSIKPKSEAKSTFR